MTRLNWDSADGRYLPRESWEPDGLAEPKPRDSRRVPTPDERRRRDARRAKRQEASERLRALAERLKEETNARLGDPPKGVLPETLRRGGGAGHAGIRPAAPGRVATSGVTGGRPLAPPPAPASQPASATPATVPVAAPAPPPAPALVWGRWCEALWVALTLDLHLSRILWDGCVRRPRRFPIPPTPAPVRAKGAPDLLVELRSTMRVVVRAQEAAGVLLASGQADGDIRRHFADAVVMTELLLRALARRQGGPPRSGAQRPRST